MYVRSVEIEGLRTFERARVALNVPTEELPADDTRLPNVTLLLGDNGAGKTTLLRAIALGALGPVLASGSGYVPFSMVRRVAGKAAGPGRVEVELELHAQDGSEGPAKLEVVLEPTEGFVDRFRSGPVPAWAEAMWKERSPAFLMVGYGASRRVDVRGDGDPDLRQKARMLRYGRVAGLFEEAVTMVPLSAWLPQWRTRNPGRHKQVVTLLNALLAPRGELLPKPVDGDYLFRVGGSDLPFHALSDGYRAFIGWAADLLYHVCMGAPSGERLDATRGVVLVDEVDLHLHPEWQRVVIPALARTLPRLQLVLTSHSPLLVGTLRRENVLVLDRVTRRGVARATVKRSAEEVFGLSSDQILTSGHFGLESPRDARFASRLQGEAKKARGGDPESAVRLLRMLALGGGEPAPEPKAAPRGKRAARRRRA